MMVWFQLDKKKKKPSMKIVIHICDSLCRRKDNPPVLKGIRSLM